MNEYATLSELRSYMSLGSADTSDDDVLRQFLRRTSRTVDRYTRRHFYPKKRVVKFDHEKSDLVRFGPLDVLEVKGLSHINGASEVDSSVYFLQCGNDYNHTPYDRIVMKSDIGSQLSFSGTEQQAIQASIIEGYHERYDDAWIDSSASLTDALGASVTMASISGSGGEDSLGISPRFSTEQLIRFSGGTASEEYAYVIDTAPTGGASHLRLIRGVNGTTPTSHAASTSIEVWDVDPDVRFVTVYLSAWAYEQARSPFTKAVAFPGMGLIEMTAKWPEDITDRLDKKVKMKHYSSRF